MSAFSNWNGPDNNGGPTLPQVTTLEQLISELRAVNTRLEVLKGEFYKHRSDGASMPDANLHVSLQTLVKATQQKLLEYITKDIHDRKEQDAKLHNELHRLAQDSAHKDLALAAKNKEQDTALVVESKQRIDADTAIQTRLNLLIQQLTGEVATATLTVSHIKAADNTAGVIVDDFVSFLAHTNFAYYTDFTRMKVISPKSIAVRNPVLDPPTQTPIYPAVHILGMLSESYDGLPTGIEPLTKPGRLYVTYGNTDRLCAIVDAVGIYNDDQYAPDDVKYKGSLAVIASTKWSGNILFGVYAGTGDSDNKVHFYIGVCIPGIDTYLETDRVFRVAGENVIPVGESGYIPPNGPVYGAAQRMSTWQGDIYYDWLAVGSLTVDNTLHARGYAQFDDRVRVEHLEDTQGHNLLSVTHAPNELTLGNSSDALKINTPSRPQIGVGGSPATVEQMAYLSDMAKSMFFQAVTRLKVTVDTAADLSGLTEIWFSAGGADKYVFVDGDIALVKSGLNPQYYRFAAGAWVIDTPNVLPPMPLASAGDYSYQWASAHKETVTPGGNLFIKAAFIIWTPNAQVAAPEDTWSVIDLAIYQLQFPVGAIVTCFGGAPDGSFEACDGGITTSQPLIDFLTLHGNLYGPATRPTQDNAYIKAFLA